MRSKNFAFGGILIAAGIAALVYSMPNISNDLSLKSKTEPAALGKSPIPALPTNDALILGIEIASIPCLVAGIIMMSLGQSEISKK